MERIWKDIEGYEGKYRVSNLGEVQSVHYHRTNEARLLTPKKNAAGYLIVGLWKDKHKKFYPVHRLVASAFLGKYEDMQVNHIDLVKDNNRVDNLEWVSPSENTWHAINHGRFEGSTKKLKQANERRKKRVFGEINGFVFEFCSFHEASGLTNVGRKEIKRNVEGKSKKAKGWKFYSS